MLVEFLNQCQDYDEEFIDEEMREEGSQRKEAKDTAIQIKAILDILLTISLRNPDLIQRNNLYPILLEILKKAQSGKKVIVEEIVSQLLDMFEKKKKQVKKQKINNFMS